MPYVEREDGARIYWEAEGDGPGVVVAPSYIQHPQVLAGLRADLARDHRVVRYDVRGAGESSPEGPYDMDTDAADLLAVAKAASPIAVVAGNGDATNRAIHAGLRDPELIPYVLSIDSLPVIRGQAAGTDALVGSSEVLQALVGMMRADYRSGLLAAMQRGNPDMRPDELRERADATVAYVGHDQALARLENWIADEPDAAALGERLVVAYEGAGGWFTAELHERGRELLPQARFVRLEGGAITRPDLTAAVIRELTGVVAA